MKIAEVTSSYIKFDNGSKITYYHYRDCCKDNYADFEQLDDLARNYEFESELKFEDIPDYGFRFGDSRRMFFVPCYSYQNGYYSSDVEILYKNETVLKVDAEIRY